MKIFFTIVGIILVLLALALTVFGMCCVFMAGNCSKYEDAVYYSSLAQKRCKEKNNPKCEDLKIEKGTV